MTSGEFYKKFDEYYEKFGKVFPATEYDLPKDEAIQLMDKCIKTNKTAEKLKPLKKNRIY